MNEKQIEQKLNTIIEKLEPSEAYIIGILKGRVQRTEFRPSFAFPELDDIDNMEE